MSPEGKILLRKIELYGLVESDRRLRSYKATLHLPDGSELEVIFEVVLAAPPEFPVVQLPDELARRFGGLDSRVPPIMKAIMAFHEVAH